MRGVGFRHRAAGALPTGAAGASSAADATASWDSIANRSAEGRRLSAIVSILRTFQANLF